MIGLDAGAAWMAAPKGRGRVRAVFSRAIHVELGSLLVIVDGAGPAGPLHLRVDRLPAITVGDEVVIAGRRLLLGPACIDLGSVPAWTAPRVGGRPRLTRLQGAERSAMAGCDDLLGRVGDLLGRDDFEGVARLLGGRGPGLTPAGDDVLAGILLTTHAFGGAEDPLVAAIDQVRTTDLSLAYLRWAARGQCVEPAHAVLAAATGEAPDRLEAAAATLCAHGASSGADLLLGIELALGVLRTDAAPSRTRGE